MFACGTGNMRGPRMKTPLLLLLLLTTLTGTGRTCRLVQIIEISFTCAFPPTACFLFLCFTFWDCERADLLNSKCQVLGIIIFVQCTLLVFLKTCSFPIPLMFKAKGTFFFSQSETFKIVTELCRELIAQHVEYLHLLCRPVGAFCNSWDFSSLKEFIH